MIHFKRCLAVTLLAAAWGVPSAVGQPSAAPKASATPTGPAASAPTAASAPSADVLGVRVGMTVDEAAAILKKKGLNLVPTYGGNPTIIIEMNPMNAYPGLWLTAKPPQLVARIEHGDGRRMDRQVVIADLRAKYGPHGVDVPTASKEDCMRVRPEDDEAYCKTRPQPRPVCLKAAQDSRIALCEQDIMGHPEKYANPSHVITWRFNDHGQPLTPAQYDRYCPPKSVAICKAITVTANVGPVDKEGFVDGFHLQIDSPSLRKRGEDEMKQMADEIEKKAHQQQVDAARRNRPQL